MTDSVGSHITPDGNRYISYQISYAQVNSPAGVNTIFGDNSLNENANPLDGTSETFVIGGLTPGTTYDFVAMAQWHVSDQEIYQDLGQSFAHVTVTTGASATPPAMPTGTHAVSLGSAPNPSTGNRIEVLWQNASNNETCFILQRLSPPTGSSPLQALIEQFNLAPDTTSFIDPMATLTGTAYYRLEAVNAGGNSGWVSFAVAVANPQSALAISWFPFHTPLKTYDLEGVLLKTASNLPPPDNFILPNGTFDQASYDKFELAWDYRNILSLTVPFSIDPYTGKFSVTPKGFQKVGSTDIGGPLFGIPISGEGQLLSPIVIFSPDGRQATIKLGSLFRLSPVEQLAVAPLNFVTARGFHMAAWVCTQIDYTINDQGQTSISFGGSAVPNQTDYVDGYQYGGYDINSNAAGVQQFLLQPFGAVAVKDNR